MGSNGKYKGLFCGTRGNPQESLENDVASQTIKELSKNDFQKVKKSPQKKKELLQHREETPKYGIPKNIYPLLTETQISMFRKKYNLIKDHVQEKDITGTTLEAQGKILMNKQKGKPWNHIREAENTIDGLNNVVERLLGSLQNPNIDTKIKKYFEEEVIDCKEKIAILVKALKGENHEK